MSNRVSRTRHVTCQSEKSNSMPLSFKRGMKFPLGGDTHVTVRPGETQPIIEISSYEQFKTPSGHHVVIPKHLGVMLTPKQFTQLMKSGASIQSAIQSFTQPKLKSNAQCSKCVIRQVKRKTSRAKENVDPKKKTSRAKDRVFRPLKRVQSCGLPKKDVSTQAEVKKQCTLANDTERVR